MDVFRFFRMEERNAKLAWGRLPDENVVQFGSAQSFDADRCYVVVRLQERFLRLSKEFWRDRHPVVFACVAHGQTSTHTVLGPDALKTVADHGQQNLVILNAALCEPLPYRGGDLTVVVALISVPGNDVVEGLVQTLEEVSKLGLAAAGGIPQVLEVVKNGVDRILNIDKRELRVGVQVTLPASKAPGDTREGVYAGIAGPAEQIDFRKLWSADSQLRIGVQAADSRPYDETDYLLVRLERQEHYHHWEAIPSLADHLGSFEAIMADGQRSAAEKTKLLAAVWPAFRSALERCPALTKADRVNIWRGKAEDYRSRLEEPNPFAPDVKMAAGEVPRFQLRSAPRVADLSTWGSPDELFRLEQRDEG